MSADFEKAMGAGGGGGGTECSQGACSAFHWVHGIVDRLEKLF